MKAIIEKLKAGETVKFRPAGHSMAPFVLHKQLVTMEPVGRDTMLDGQIVLCKVQGRNFLHFAGLLGDGKYRIANAKGRVNGWCYRHNIFGVVVSIET